VDMSFYINIYL